MRVIIILLLIFIIYYGQLKIYYLYWDKKLKVDVRFSEKTVEVGTKTKLVVKIENRKWFIIPVFNLKISTPRTFVFEDKQHAVVTDRFYRNEGFSVMPNQRITRKLSFTPSRRGYYKLSMVDVVTKDLFFTRTFARNYDTNTSLYVLPRKLSIENDYQLEKSLMGEIETRHSLVEDPFSFAGIREYNVNDTMKMINWKATAKGNSLMVNMYDRVAEYKVVILVNLDTDTPFKKEALIESAFELASTLCEGYALKGIPVMVEVNGIDSNSGKKNRIYFGSSVQHSIEVDKYLAKIDRYYDDYAFVDMLDLYKEKVADYASYIIVSPSTKNDLLNKLDEFVSEGLKVAMIFPYSSKEKMQIKRDYIIGWEVDVDEFYQNNA